MPLSPIAAGARACIGLTKPLGTGLLATALKRSEPEAIQDGGRLQQIYTAGVVR